MPSAASQKQAQREAFPICLFALYVLFYSGQSIYNTYLNLYLSSEGLSDTEIGFIVSVSTLFILMAQLFWGWVSDRVKVKNRVLELLYLATAIISLLFYAGSSFWFLLAAVTLFSIFFNPIIPLQDNYALEYLETSRWDYGQIRMGGTLGYSITVLVIGFLLHDDYRVIFWMVAICMALCRALCFTMPKVSGYAAKEKHTSWRELLNNKTLLGLILFNMMFSIGLNFYHSFYPIYYTKIGGNSSLVGTMMFLSAMSEVPMLMIIRKVEDRIGIRAALIIAGLATTLRWVLLAFVKDPYIAIAVNLLQGVGYTTFSYSLVTYIARSMPRDLRATGQTMNAMIGSVVSRVLFGFIGGAASDTLGTDHIMLLSACLMAVSTVVFYLWSRKRTELGRL